MLRVTGLAAIVLACSCSSSSERSLLYVATEAGSLEASAEPAEGAAGAVASAGQAGAGGSAGASGAAGQGQSGGPPDSGPDGEPGATGGTDGSGGTAGASGTDGTGGQAGTGGATGTAGTGGSAGAPCDVAACDKQYGLSWLCVDGQCQWCGTYDYYDCDRNAATNCETFKGSTKHCEACGRPANQC